MVLFCLSISITRTAAATMQLNKRVYRTNLCDIKIGLIAFYFLKSDLGKVGHHRLSSQKTQQDKPSHSVKRRVTGDLIDQPAALCVGRFGSLAEETSP